MANKVYIERYIPVVRLARGLFTKLPINTTSTMTVGSNVFQAGANSSINAPLTSHTPVAANATATLTAAQVASGYITSTSASATTLTLPTGTLLGTALGATQGTTFDFWVDNTAGANTVTIAVAVNGIINSAATAGTAAGFGLLTIPNGVTGQGRFSLAFSSATAYTFARTA